MIIRSRDFDNFLIKVEKGSIHVSAGHTNLEFPSFYACKNFISSHQRHLTKSKTI